MGPKRKTEIIDVNLDINLEDEIKKYCEVTTSRTHIDRIIEQAKSRQRPKKSSKEDELWYPRFEKLFESMTKDSSKEFSKDEIVKTLDIQAKQFGPAMSRYKKFLRINKNDWTLTTINGHQRTYVLKPIPK